MLKIDKNELRYIICSGIFGIIWFLFLMPYLAKTLDGSVYGQFLIFNLGLYIFFFIFLKAVITKNSHNFVTTLGIILLFLGTDTILPEYHVTITGVLTEGANLGASSTDYLFGTIAHNFGWTWNIAGISFVYIFTYFIAPLLLLILSALLLKDLTKHL